MCIQVPMLSLPHNTKLHTNFSFVCKVPVARSYFIAYCAVFVLILHKLNKCWFINKIVQ